MSLESPTPERHNPCANGHSYDNLSLRAGRAFCLRCGCVAPMSAYGPQHRDTPADTDEGRKDDSDKIRIELVPPELVLSVSTILTFGANKYADRNWEKGMSWGRVFGACMRHMWAWWGGKGPTTKNFALGDLDDETGHSHLWHAGCCIAFLIAYEERGVGTDDRAR